MKIIIAAAAAAGATLLASPAFAASAAVTAGMCSPLSEANMEQCCAADNWKDVVRAEDIQYCPPLKDDTSGQSGRKGTKFGGAGGGANNNSGSGNAGAGGTGSNNNENGSGN